MSWLFPEPELDAGDAIEWKTKAQLAPETGRQTTGVLYLTTRHVWFVPGRGTPRARNFVTRFARTECTDVAAVEGRFGYGMGQSVWKCMELKFTGDRRIRVWVRRRDKTVDLLRLKLVGPSQGRATTGTGQAEWPPAPWEE